jgi:hypothetical protein
MYKRKNGTMKLIDVFLGLACGHGVMRGRAEAMIFLRTKINNKH